MTAPAHHSPPETGPGTAGPARWLHLITAPSMLVVFGALLTAGSLVVLGQHLAGVTGPTDDNGQLVTGDYMAFYTGANMIRRGGGPHLYDLQRQHDFQEALTGRAGPWQPYVNPPLLAILLAPSTALPFSAGLWVFSAVMLTAFVVTVRWWRRLFPTLMGSRLSAWAVVLIVFSFHPIARTMLGGQNTMLTLCLLTGLTIGLMHDRVVLAGVMLGLLTYKPQFALLIGVVLAVRGQLAVLGGAAVVAVGHYAVGALFCGLDWPVAMLECLRVYQPFERTASYHTHVALLPACDFALAAPWNRWIPAVILPVVALWTLHVARRPRRGRPWHGCSWAVVVVATLLISPHLQFYDLGVLVLPALLVLEAAAQRGSTVPAVVRGGLILAYLLFPIYDRAPELGWQPLVLWPVAAFAWMAWTLHTDPDRPVTRDALSAGVPA